MNEGRKSIAIIGEGETEWFYFDSLRVVNKFAFKIAPDFPAHSDFRHILKLAETYVLKEYDYVICLIDMDRLMSVPKEMTFYKKEKIKRKYKNVTFIETNPCTEFWFLLHFLPTFSTKYYPNYDSLIVELRKYMPGYVKTKKYFKKINLYNYLKLNGNIENAIENSSKLCKLTKKHPEDAIAYSEIYKIFEILKELKPM